MPGPRTTFLLPVTLLGFATAAPAGAAVPQGAPVRACAIRSGALQRTGQRYSVRFVANFRQCPKRAGHLWVRLQGLPGPATVQGPRGPQGIPGQVGDVGAPGPVGAAGPSGPAGAQGAAGERGDRGATGADGVPGPQGEAGPQGIAGPQGETGPQGEAGPQGEPGAQGEPGPAGAQGPQGDPGPTGPAGPAYSMGHQVVNVSTALDTEPDKLTVANCPETAQVVVGGGYDYGGGADDIDWFVVATRPNSAGRGWYVHVHRRADDGRADEPWQLRVYAVCVRDPARG